MHKIGQSEGLLGRILGSLLKTKLPLIVNVPKPLPKSVLIPLGLTAPALATYAAVHQKMFGSGTTTLIISSEEVNDIMKNNKSLKESDLLIKWVSEIIENEAKEQKGGFLGMLLDSLDSTF